MPQLKPKKIHELLDKKFQRKTLFLKLIRTTTAYNLLNIFDLFAGLVIQKLEVTIFKVWLKMARWQTDGQ